MMVASSYDLPPDVFGPDEKRPERAMKKKIIKRKQNGGISEVRYSHKPTICLTCSNNGA